MCGYCKYCSLAKVCSSCEEGGALNALDDAFSTVVQSSLRALGYGNVADAMTEINQGELNKRLE